MTPFGQHPADLLIHAHLGKLEARLRRRLEGDRCAWNRQVEVTPIFAADGETALPLGTARGDGTLALRADVLDRLRDLWARPGATRTEQQQRLQQRARSTLRHELDHFIHPDGERYRDGLVEYRRWTTRAFEEGETECVAQNHADIDAAEMEALSPGMTSVRFSTSYQQFTPAVRTLADYTGGLLGRRQAEIVDELGREAIQGKYTRLAHLVLEARGLWQRIPEDERVDCQMQVAQEVRNVFWRNSDWAKRDAGGRLGTSDPAGRSHVMGLQAAAAAERARLEIEHRYGTPRQEGVSWELAAAMHEYELAQKALQFAQRRPAADVRRAAAQWLDKAAHGRDAAREWESTEPVLEPRPVRRSEPERGSAPADRESRLSNLLRRRPHRARPDLGRAR